MTKSIFSLTIKDLGSKVRWLKAAIIKVSEHNSRFLCSPHFGKIYAPTLVPS